MVVDLLKEEELVRQISSEYGLHANQLYRWKAQALEGLPGLFEKDNKAEKTQDSLPPKTLKQESS